MNSSGAMQLAWRGLAILVMIGVWSCGGDSPIGTLGPSGRLAIVPTFASPDVIALDEVGNVRLIIRRQDGSVALDQLQAVESRTVDLLVEIAFTPPCEAFGVELFLLDGSDAVLFGSDPGTVTVCEGQVASHQPTLRYVGVGSNAASVTISPGSQAVVVGEAFAFEAQALSASGEAIPGTPVRWAMLHPELATIASERLGAGEATAVGSTMITATLLTGQSATARLTIVERPALVRSPAALAFSAIEGEGDPPAQTVQIANGGGGTLEWSVAADAEWVTVTPASGSAAAETDLVTVAAKTSGLTAGIRTATVTISAPGAGSPQTVPVTLVIAEPAPVLVRAPATLAFAAVAGEGNPSSQTVQISNGGGGTLAWSVSEDASWVTVTPASGSATAETDVVTVAVNTTGLEAGTHTATLAIGAGDAIGSPQTVGVTLVLAEPEPVLVRAPAALAFGAIEGDPSPSSQTVQISNGGGGTLAWSVSEDAEWLTVAPRSGSASTETDVVTVAVNTTGLEAGTRTATVTIAAAGAGSSPQTVPVTLVIAEPPPVLVRAPAALTFTAVEGAKNPSSKTVQIANGGGGTLEWSVSDDAPWVILKPESGSATEETDVVTVVVNTGGRSAGTYTATVTIAAEGAESTPQTVAITFVITEPPPELVRAPATLVFTAVEGAGNPSPQTVQISNGGGGTLAWSVGDDAPWVSATPASGTATSETDAVTVGVNTSGLAAGTHTATLTLTAAGAGGSPRTVGITLDLAEPPPVLVRSPTNLAFSGIAGEANPPSQTVQISNDGGGTLAWSVSDDAPWVSVTPSSGSATSEADAVMVSVNTAGLSAGTHAATVTITGAGAGGSPQGVAINLTLAEPTPVLVRAPAALAFTQLTGYPPPPGQTIQIANGGDGALEWTVTAGQRWVTVAPASGSTRDETDLVTVRVDAADLPIGTHTATLTIAAEGATGSPQTVEVLVTLSEPPPELVRSPASLRFEGTAGGETSLQTIAISNGAGAGTLHWSVSADQQWVYLDPASGSATEERDEVRVGANLVGLKPGDYRATITINAPGAEDSPQTVAVALTVAAARPFLIGVNAVALPNTRCVRSSLYRYTIAFVDADGDVLQDRTTVFGNVVFDDEKTRSFEIPPKLNIVEGNGFSGTITGESCLAFGKARTADVTITIADAFGNVSNGQTISLPRPDEED